MYIPTAKGYFSGCGGMELGMMLAEVNVIQSLDIDIESTNCMKNYSHYFSHKITFEFSDYYSDIFINK